MFIRTKEGKIYNCEWLKISDNLNGKPYVDKNGNVTYKENILRYTDTIQELCDTFVFVVDNQGYLIVDSWKQTIKYLNNYNEDNNCECYGAIWTNKGLIYVAKMNEKGELELL